MWGLDTSCSIILWLLHLKGGKQCFNLWAGRVPALWVLLRKHLRDQSSFVSQGTLGVPAIFRERLRCDWDGKGGHWLLEQGCVRWQRIATRGLASKTELRAIRSTDWRHNSWVQCTSGHKVLQAMLQNYTLMCLSNILQLPTRTLSCSTCPWIPCGHDLWRCILFESITKHQRCQGSHSQSMKHESRSLLQITRAKDGSWMTKFVPNHGSQNVSQMPRHNHVARLYKQDI